MYGAHDRKEDPVKKQLLLVRQPTAAKSTTSRHAWLCLLNSYNYSILHRHKVLQYGTNRVRAAIPAIQLQLYSILRKNKVLQYGTNRGRRSEYVCRGEGLRVVGLVDGGHQVDVVTLLANPGAVDVVAKTMTCIYIHVWLYKM